MNDDIHIKDREKGFELYKVNPEPNGRNTHKYYTLCGDLVFNDQCEIRKMSIYRPATCLGCVMVRLANLAERDPETFQEAPDD